MKKHLLIFLLLTLFTLSSCKSEKNINIKQTEYTEENINFIWSSHDNYYTKLYINKNPICAEVSTSKEKFLINIIYFSTKDVNGHKEHSRIFYNYRSFNSIKDLEHFTEKDLYSLVTKIENNYDEINLEFSFDEYDIKYYIINYENLSIPKIEDFI